MADIQITQMPRLPGDKSGTITDRVVAQPIDHSVRLASNQSPNAGDADGLLRGLSQFNSALGQYTDHSIEVNRQEQLARAQRRAAADAAIADASTPEAVQKRVAADIPAELPAAYGGVYREALGALLVDRGAVAAKTQWAADYDTARKDPAFDSEAFIAQQRQKYLTGLNDPGLAGRMAVHLNEMEGAARVSAERDRLKKVDELTNTGLFSAMQENIRADMKPEEQASQFFKYQPLWEALGKSKKELATMLFTRQQALSEQMGGEPGMFSVFDQKDPTTGQTLLALNPELAQHVEAARTAAKTKQQHLLLQAAEQNNVKTLDDLNQVAEKGQGTLEMVQQNFGPLGVFKTAEQGAAWLHASRKAAEKLQGQADLMAAADAGMLGRYDPKDQKQVLEAKLGPQITATWAAAVSQQGTPEDRQKAVLGLAAYVMSEQNRYRSTEAIPAIERLVQSNLTTTQDPNGPPAGFSAMADLYRGLSADPKYRGQYFKDDADQLMRRYLAGVDGGSDPAAAYKAAYQAISPEAKAAGEAFAKTPEFAKKLKNVADNVQGVGFMQRWFGWGQEPGNKLNVQMAATEEARNYLATRPYADPKEVNEHLSSWVSQNYVMDSNSGTAIRVPAGAADATTQEALSEYSKRVAEQYRLSDRKDGKWTVQFRPLGDGNISQVVLSNGSAEQNLGTVPLASIRQAHVAEQSTTEQDRQVLSEVQKQFTTGKLDLNFIASNSSVLDKAERLKLLPDATLQGLDKARLTQARQMVDSIPKLALPAPSFENLQTVPTRAVKVDNKLTAQVAQQFLGGAQGDLGLAASLTTMGEAVVLKASPDPAKDAGYNIGMGYNLKANAKNARADLVRAGVSEDRVDAVIAGQAQLTPVQAQKLLMVALPRYQSQAQSAAEETAPGLWKRMTPYQRAVMTDVGWQTGDPSQFRKAWRALASGDAQSFANETKVFFTNAKGERVEDKRRSELRAAMLNGDTAWITAINKYAGYPSTALDALALNQPSQ